MRSLSQPNNSISRSSNWWRLRRIRSDSCTSRKEKQVRVCKKIEYSMQLNASRIKVLQAQDDLVNSMKDSASKELLGVSIVQKNYKNLLKNVIVQCLLSLKEPSTLLRCRKEDVQLAPSKQNEHDRLCFGGVVLASREGKILFENTLDARLEVVFRKKLPELCKSLLGHIVA
ncbi:V-type proton ATPase subunit E-like isoform X2 [Salvia divinorum]|uniref:V-type proton ATPase subunit E-like isoform X2 n=1 Tax=Salvia divinorum TaxID=28513 RepID=A0ABD1GNM0_SALDI